MKEPNFSFSPEDFKKWIEHHDVEKINSTKVNTIIGTHIESKINTKRLLKHIRPKDGELCEIASDFKHNGGIIYDVEEHDFLVEVDSGFFYIPKFFVKKQ